MTLALALKGRQGVLLMSDRLERREGQTIEVRKLYRHPWGLITGYGKGHLLTPVKEYLERLAGKPQDDLVRVVGQFTPFEMVHGVIEGMVTEMREAWQESGAATFVYSLPAEYVPARYSKLPNAHPLAVIVDNGVRVRETGHGNVPVDTTVAAQFGRLLRDLDFTTARS